MAGKRATKIDSMLRHLAAGGEAQDFPGTKYENLAVARTIVRRGLITWDGEGNRYVLTPAGWNELTPRRFGLPSLVVSTATGAAIGAAVLAFLWLPGARWQDSALGHAMVAMQSPAAAPSSVPTDIGGRSVAPMSATAPKPAAERVPSTEPSAAPATPSEPAQVASEPAAEQPTAEAAPAATKQAAAKKHHRRTARSHEQYNPFANQWRGQQYQQTRYGQGSWFAYR